MHKILFSTLLLASASFATADEHPLTLWQLEGEHNRIYLLGSVHLLREQDYPVPSAIDDAYRDAETLLMELDMDDLDEAAVQRTVVELGMIKGDQTLADILGNDAYAEASELAEGLGVPLMALNTTEPWLAAISIETMMLSQIGFDPDFGIEAYLAGKAGQDSKEILGLEEMAEQLGYLDGLSLSAQRALLLETLREAGTLESMMDTLITAWRHGDVEFLEASTLADMQNYPELYDALVVRRNRNWVGQIVELLDDQQDYLIVVGALHLVGEDSVVSLLRERGNDVTQLQQTN